MFVSRYQRLLLVTGSGTNPGQGYQFWTLLPYEQNVIGERLVTRQEIDLPFQAGPGQACPLCAW